MGDAKLWAHNMTDCGQLPWYKRWYHRIFGKPKVNPVKPMSINDVSGVVDDVLGKNFSLDYSITSSTGGDLIITVNGITAKSSSLPGSQLARDLETLLDTLSVATKGTGNNMALILPKEVGGLAGSGFRAAPTKIDQVNGVFPLVQKFVHDSRFVVSEPSGRYVIVIKQ